MSTYNRVVAADETASLAPEVRARLATEMADPASEVGASLSGTFATVVNVAGYASVESAVAALTSGSTLYFPPGAHYGNILLNSLDNISIIGDGATLDDVDGTRPVVRLNGCTNVTIRGLTVTNSSATVRDSVNHGFRLDSCTGVLMDAVKVTGAEAAGILFSGGQGVHVSRCVITNTLADGIHFTDGVTNFRATGNSVYLSGDDGIAVVSYATSGLCADFVISNNTVINGKSRGIAVVGGDRGTISDNLTRSTRNSGIYIAQETAYPTYGCDSILVSDNQVHDANTYADPTISMAGIHVTGNDVASPVIRIRVRGNTVIGSRWRGLTASGTAAAISDIAFENNFMQTTLTAEGAHFSNVTGLTVIGNSIVDAYHYGIWVDETCLGSIRVCDNVILRPNRVLVAYIDAMNIRGPGDFIVTGNHFLGAASDFQNAIEAVSVTGSLQAKDNIGVGSFVWPSTTIAPVLEYQRTTSGSAAPSGGAWARGDICHNTAPSASGNVGWVCVTAGTPGTWKAFGTIAA